MPYRTKLALAVLATLLVFSAPARAATIFFQNFEGALGGNESTAGLFAINTTGFGNNGTRMMGHPTGYTNDEYSYYQVIVDLTGATSAAMSFDFRGSFEDHFDGFNVIAGVGVLAPPVGLLSPTGASNMQYLDQGHPHRPELGNFTYDTSAATGGGSGIARFDLNPFLGSIVTLRFQFGTDFSITDTGFNMDNLLIEGDVTAVPEPASMLLVGFGTAALAARRARRRK